MHKRLINALLATSLMVGVLATAIPAAQAATPFDVSNFYPNDRPWGAVVNNFISDKFDGTDQTAHLTAVATADSDNAAWYACNNTLVAGSDQTVTQANFGAKCTTLIGTDASARRPIGGSQFSPTDNAFDTFWDIPGSLDGATVDIITLACTGAGTDIEGSDANCIYDAENDIFLEDAQTGVAANQTSSAEIVSYCTADTSGPSSGATNECQVGGAGAGSASDVTARFKPFPHGSNAPNTGFVFRVTSSDDVTNINAVLDPHADAQNEPPSGGQSTIDSCALLQTGANFKLWECDVSAANASDANVSPEKALGVYENTGGAGECSDAANGGAGRTCMLDIHYIVTGPRQAATATQSFVPGGNHAHGAPNTPNGTNGCTAGKTPVKSHNASSLNQTEAIQICLTDQFSDPFSGPYTEELTGPGTFTGCGTGHDHDNNGSIEHCHGTTDANGQATNTVANFGATTGTVTITSCSEGQPQTGSSPPANHGCANEATALKDTLTLNYGTQVQRVLAAFAPSASGDPCRGSTFAQGEVGDSETFVVCTIDANGNPVATGDNAFLQYTIRGAHGNDVVAVRFNPAPPPDDTESNGQVTVGLDDVAEGDNFIDIDVRDQTTGDLIDTFTIEKQVTGGTPPPRDVPTDLTARKGRKFIRGKAKTEDECQPGRSVTLFRRHRGPDDVIGTDTTNQFGRWGVKTGRRRGTYYARIAASQATDAQTGGQLNCLADQSKDVRRG